ncbi:MAG: MBL fold metallo-hydrolase [Desulfovibrionaceae bacterium]|nr:MBL fold metallo-hydrolase [Desulfovibrionaceae bacterium]
MLVSVALIAFLAVLLVVAGNLFPRQEKFGRLPQGDRLAKVQRSPNWRDGAFRNRVPIRRRAQGGSALRAFAKFFFQPRENPTPPGPVPVVKTDLKALDKGRDLLVWLGHSSWFLQLGGRTILIDPVFSAYASPVFFSTRAFEGANPYTAADMPEIDLLLVSHDHWDHLDHATVTALRPRVRQVVTGLGVGEHFARWGFPESMVREADWDEAVRLERGAPDDALTVHVLTARHFSGRWLDRNKTLWASFALLTPKRSVFYSGDSGYGPHFKELGERFGGFDVALLDSGQYADAWPGVHMAPERSAQAAVDLRARAALPSHAGKFSIAFHSWDDPFRRFVAASRDKPYRLLTPRIGEVVDLADERQSFSRWWE